MRTHLPENNQSPIHKRCLDKLGILLRKVIVAIMPNWCILKTRLKCGITILGLNRPGYGGRGVFIHREDRELEFKWLQDFLEETDNFLDIGANTGIYTLKAAKYAPKGVVISCEPQVGILAMLERSAAENHFDNIRLRNLVVSDQVGIARLHVLHDRPNEATIVDQPTDGTILSTLSTTVDALLEWEKIDRIAYIKIDAEGAEPMILKGASETIRQCKPIIQCEDTLVNMKDSFIEGYIVLKHPESCNIILTPSDHGKIPSFLEKGFVRID